jgi:hypothetical protein
VRTSTGFDIVEGPGGNVLKKILLAVAVLVAAGVVVVMVQPSTYRVERSAEIAAPAEILWGEITDFYRWKAWNPWEKMEPGQKISVSGTPGELGHSSTWAGEKTGQGSMTIASMEKPKHLDIHLDFRKPLASEAKTTFDLVPNGEKVKVTWAMEGKNSFVGKFFGLVMDMEGMIGSAYEQGLSDLKAVAEAKTAEGGQAVPTKD